jgi:CelD/BcsL family acetyltransferase involved in cellulose biosynthesis
MRWDWLELWWHHAADDAQIVISTARDANGHLLALVPLMIRPYGEGRRRHLRELTYLGGSGEIDADGLEAMVRPGREHLLAPCWDLALASVKYDWDIAHFSYLDRASPLTRYLTDALDRRGISRTEINPLPSRYIPLPQDWESYAKTRSKNFRKKLARLNREAADRFKVEIRLPENAASASVMFRQLLDLHAERWSVSQSLFLQPRTQAFHNDLIQRWITLGRIVLMVMTFDGAPVAANYAFIDHGRLWDYQGGWRTDYAAFCPSKLILQANISLAMERGVKEYDFLPGPNPYKISWCPEQREVFDLEGFNQHSFRATIYTSMRTLKRAITSLLPVRTPTESGPDSDSP